MEGAFSKMPLALVLKVSRWARKLGTYRNGWFRAAFSFVLGTLASVGRDYHLSSHYDSDVQWLLMVGSAQKGQLQGETTSPLETVR